ncbi:PAS and ANTAR domain-containing protein [Mycolicibacterium arenosum]|uniref:PAS and ANTAR domain-containing protein n=1 Tax=Mycolicibacterium arenosum TaxID=2952157 RepID=A0ABT1MGC7_9MYCO|nr:PAS and ANTAR domain-containing protein [Mycolicibacterium sp. CAU 1645]MCP9276807.1 PAS and ANTAR domain-containing protein [Mycolicibacterium sp. CAU 1645]
MSVNGPSEREVGLADQAAADAAETGVDGQRASPLDKAILGGPPQRVGRFEYRYDTDTWMWSDTVARIHGYEPGEVTPTTDLVLKHKHPDDLAQVRALLSQTAAPFSSRHRIITTTGLTRRVVVVGDAVTDDDDRVVATRGFYIDITDSFDGDLQQSLSEELDVILAHREIIDLAKGMLMAVYRINADAAFAVLRWRSQELNVKLFTVAEKLVDELPEILGTRLSATTPVDHYLMSLAFE